MLKQRFKRSESKNNFVFNKLIYKNYLWTDSDLVWMLKIKRKKKKRIKIRMKMKRKRITKTMNSWKITWVIQFKRSKLSTLLNTILMVKWTFLVWLFVTFLQLTWSILLTNILNSLTMLIISTETILINSLSKTLMKALQ